jgi:hypothetical protein
VSCCYPMCKFHIFCTVLYFHLWPVWLYLFFPHYKGVSKSFKTSSIDRQPMAVHEWVYLGAGNVTTQHAEWHRCVNTGSCRTRVFITTCVFTFAISAWTWNWGREQTSNFAWNSANLERRLLKWYDVHIEMRPWVVRGVSSGTRASREAEHHSKMTRVQGNLPRTQHLRMGKQFGGLCMWIVGESLRTLLQSLMCHMEQCRQF